MLLYSHGLLTDFFENTQLNGYGFQRIFNAFLNATKKQQKRVNANTLEIIQKKAA